MAILLTLVLVDVVELGIADVALVVLVLVVFWCIVRTVLSNRLLKNSRKAFACSNGFLGGGTPQVGLQFISVSSIPNSDPVDDEEAFGSNWLRSAAFTSVSCFFPNGLPGMFDGLP